MRLPDRDRLVVDGHLLVAAEHADLDARPVDAELLGELERPGDRLALEVVADREVAEHLEEGQWRAVCPTLSMSEVRKQRWQVVSRAAGGVSTPR